MFKRAIKVLAVVSPSAVVQGGAIDVSGTGFAADESVPIAADGATLGTATADADGAFTVTLLVPATVDAGSVTVTATGAAGEATATLTVTAASK